MTALPLTWPPLVAAAGQAARERGANGWILPHGTNVEAALLSDLTRPESRDWLARELAGMLGLEVGCTAPTWMRQDPSFGPWWELSVGRVGMVVGTVICPPLALLDPDDDEHIGEEVERLSDEGSRTGDIYCDGPRLVDVVALGVVALWVWGEACEDGHDSAAVLNDADAMAEEYAAGRST